MELREFSTFTKQGNVGLAYAIILNQGILLVFP